MKCPKCGSENVNFQIINEQKLVTKHHVLLWWLGGYQLNGFF